MPDLDNIFLEIYDKYSDHPLVKNEYVDKDTILFAFENSIIKVIRYITQGYPYILWDFDYKPVIYVINKNFLNVNVFDPYQMDRKFYLLLLSHFIKELKKEIYFSSVVSEYKKFRNKLLVGTIVARQKDYYEILLADKEKDKAFYSIMRKKQGTGFENKNIYKEDAKLFFSFYNIAKMNNKPYIFLTRRNLALPILLIRYQIPDILHDFVKTQNRQPVLTCVKRIPNSYSIIVVSDKLFIPKKVLQATQKLLYSERIYVYNTEQFKK